MSETYFLGAVTSEGFKSSLDNIINSSDYFSYILKGGAGTGKSSIMKKIAEHFEKKYNVIKYYCSSDPNSLDAIVIPKIKIAVVDGTSPHVYDPCYPGICQKIINLGDYWNIEKLKNNNEIIELINVNKSLHKRIEKFITASSAIYKDIYQTGKNAIIYEKINGFIKRFEKKILKNKKSKCGQKTFSRITALTEYGFLTLNETLNDYSDIRIINDEFITATDYFISQIADTAILYGYNVIISLDQLSSDSLCQHLLIPELSMAFISKTAINDQYEKYADYKKINLMRFYNKSLINQKKMHFRINKAILKNLIDETVCTIKSAKSVHDKIEAFYISSMNFHALDLLTKQIISEIENI